MSTTTRANDEDWLKLDKQLCFPMYACAKEIVKQYTPFLDEIDLTYTQYIAMMVMWEQKSVNVKEMGHRLYLDSGTLTPLLKRLEAKGLVKRERSAKDERQLCVTITDKGEMLKQQASEVPSKVGKCIDLSLEEVGMLHKTLHKILNQITNS